MCRTCGCGVSAGVQILNLQTGAERELRDDDRIAVSPARTQPGGATSRAEADHAHLHSHAHDHCDGVVHTHEHVHAKGLDEHHHHDHDHDHRHGDHAPASVIDLERAVLAKNDKLASRNRGWFAGREILAVNLVSSPGSGKTTLLERTIRALKDELSIAVIEGDQATANDGERIRAAGAAAVQVNTGVGCHLEADMIAEALDDLRPKVGSVVLIENVGNLVCPAMFDLGERAKAIVLSITEGEDKPLKYPHMFQASDVMIVNKIDLAPHVDFDVAKAVANALTVNPNIAVLRVSARTGEGMEAWYEWLRRHSVEARGGVRLQVTEDQR